MPKIGSKTPAFNYVRWNKRRGDIYSACISNAQFIGQILDPDIFSVMVTILRKVLKLKVAHESALRNSLLEFGGLELTEEIADRIAVRLAGGYDIIKKTGKPITANTTIPEKGEWMAIEVAEMRFDSVRNGKARIRMTALILTGALSGRVFSQVMPAKATTYFFANSLGWGKYEGRPAHSELVQMKFNGLVVPDDRNGFQIDEYKCSPSQIKLNKCLRAQRKEPCLRNYRYQCKTCPIGYSKCPRGTHRYSWVARKCSVCEDERAIFDPAEPNAKVCLQCRSRSVRSAWARERRGVT